MKQYANEEINSDAYAQKIMVLTTSVRDKMGKIYTC